MLITKQLLLKLEMLSLKYPDPRFQTKTRQFPHLFSDLVFESSTQLCEPVRYLTIVT